MNIIFSRTALRNLEKLDIVVRKRIIQKLEFYLMSNNPIQYAEKMKDRRFGDWRIRIGDYRVLFDIEKDKAYILKIGHRREIYK